MHINIVHHILFKKKNFINFIKFYKFSKMLFPKYFKFKNRVVQFIGEGGGEG